MGFRLYGAIGIALAILAAFATLTISRNYWKGQAGDWKEEALGWRKSTGEVTAMIANRTGNPKLKWKNVGSQIDQIITSRDSWKTTSGEQTAAIDAMGAEAERLRGLNAELRKRAEKEIAKRQVAIDRLASQATDPGERENCQQQIAAAEAALDAIYEEGL